MAATTGSRQQGELWTKWAVRAVRSWDQFAFVPVPRFYKHTQPSKQSVVATFVVIVITLVYAGIQISKFANPTPAVSAATTQDEHMRYPLGPVALAVVHPTTMMDPYSIRPYLTVDRSYMSISTFFTNTSTLGAVSYWDETAQNTITYPTDVCAMATPDEARRTTWRQEWCRESASGQCPSTRLCTQPGTPGLDMHDSCRTQDLCGRVEVKIDQCREADPPRPPPTARPPRPKANNFSLPSEWDITLRSATTGYNTESGLLLVRPRADPPLPYGIVCDDYLGADFARTICDFIGSPTKYAHLMDTTEYPLCNETECHFYVDDWNCQSIFRPNVTGLNRCDYLYWPSGIKQHNCEFYERIGVACPANPPAFEFKLGNSTGTNTSGLIMLRGSPHVPFATMCRTNFSEADAAAVCREMGFNVSVARILPQGEVGTGINGAMYQVIESNCSQTTTANFSECAIVNSGDEVKKTCRYEDVAIDCSMVHRQTHWEYKIVDGVTGDVPSTPSGILLVRPSPNAEWGGVCTMGFNGMAAAAACRALGYNVPSARVMRPTFNGSQYRPPGNIYIEDVVCSPGNVYLDQCAHTSFPPGTPLDNHSFDCGAFGDFYVHQRFGLHMSNLAWIDCSHWCAEEADIKKTLQTSFLELSLELQGAEGVPFVATSREPINPSINYVSDNYFGLHTTIKEPDYFRRFSTEESTRLVLDENAKMVQGTAATNAEDDAPMPVLKLTLQLGSQYTTETQQFVSILDLIGSINALRGAFTAVFALIFIRWNRNRFYQMNPKWDDFDRDFVRGGTNRSKGDKKLPPAEADGAALLEEALIQKPECYNADDDQPAQEMRLRRVSANA